MKLVIDRKKWLRGDGVNSYLLRPSDQKMCCLGFYSLALGYTEEEIESVSEPENLILIHKHKNRFSKEFINGCETILTNRLMSVNDEEKITEPEREEKIKNLFAEAGVEVEFVGE